MRLQVDNNQMINLDYCVKLDKINSSLDQFTIIFNLFNVREPIFLRYDNFENREIVYNRIIEGIKLKNKLISLGVDEWKSNWYLKIDPEHLTKW